MPRTKQPVSIAGIEFDALLEQSRQLNATIPQYVTEKGYKISDAIILEPETLSMTLFVTDTPVTWRAQHGIGRTNDVCRRLEQLYFSKTPVTVVTSDGTYTNMGIQSITLAKTPEVGYAREIPITFQKIRTTAARDVIVDVSDYYGNGGATGVNAGTANTTQKDGGKTILYSVLESLGLMDTVLGYFGG